MYFQNSTTLWTTDWQTPSMTFCKYTRDSASMSSSWSLAPGFCKAAFVDSNGVSLASEGRGLTGWTDPATGVFHVIVATGAGLLKFNTQTEVATVIFAACPNTQMKGVVMAPMLPSPSSTRSATQSSGATPSITASVTSSPSTTPTTTPSPSASPSKVRHTYVDHLHYSP